MKKIAVFSDIHGNLEALESIIHDIKQKGITDIYSLGDVVSIGPNSKECLDLIMTENINFLLGNHEDYCHYGFGDEKVSENELLQHQWIN